MSAPLLALILVGASPQPATIATAVLADGSTLVVARTPGATTAALRYLVHTGADADPLHRSGLAHLVEHLLFRGHEGRRQHALFAAARARGLRINGHTTLNRTVFELDGPLDGFRATLPDYLDVLTAPAISKRDLGIERAVVSAENTLSPGQSIESLAITLLAPVLRDRATVIGSTTDRELVRAEEARGFVAQHYRPRNVTIIVSGDLGLDDARSLVETASRLAPHPEPPPRPQDPAALRTPVEASLVAPVFLELIGFELVSEEATRCEGLAELLTLRLRARLDGAIESHTHCLLLSGHHLLIAAAQSETHPDGDLGDLVASAFASVRDQPLTPAERGFIGRRAERRRARLLAHPLDLADALVERASRSRDDLTGLLAAPELDAGRLRSAARAAFVEQRRVRLSVRPY